MRYVKLGLSLAFFVPAFTLLGAGANPSPVGPYVGAMIGVFFGLVFGGNPDWKFWDHIFGPKDPNDPDDSNRDGK